jgi:hypothetical protein
MYVLAPSGPACSAANAISAARDSHSVWRRTAGRLNRWVGALYLRLRLERPIRGQREIARSWAIDSQRRDRLGPEFAFGRLLAFSRPAEERTEDLTPVDVDHDPRGAGVARAAVVFVDRADADGSTQRAKERQLVVALLEHHPRTPSR